VSNPPYFQSSLKNPDAQRATARHTDSLSYSELIKHSGRLLKNNGMLALVLPIKAEEEILSLATAAGLLPSHITYVHTKPGKPAKRILIALRKGDANGNVESKHFYIESEDSPRSEEYRKLTEDFYL
jgi:tRNA1Val (adenine37-N6)-methyltransferase